MNHFIVLTIIVFLSHLSEYEGVNVDANANGDKEWLAKKKANRQMGMFDKSRMHVLRLVPEEDLLESIFRYARALNISAASVVSVVGSLHTVNIRYANMNSGTRKDGHFEIVSVSGNIDFQQYDYDSGHLHVAVSDEEGVTVGGHMLQGNLVYTTAEITLVELVGGYFVRELDEKPQGSGYDELTIHHTTRQEKLEGEKH